MIKLIFVLLLCLCCAFAAASGKYNPVANKNATVTCYKWRVTVLTQRIIRLEHSKAIFGSAKFDDRPTLAIVNRNLAVPRFAVGKTSDSCTIGTGVMNVTVKDKLLMKDQLEVSIAANGKLYKWHPGENDTTGNLGGTYFQGSLDCYSTPEKCFSCKAGFKGCSALNVGLLSTKGWSLWDDTHQTRMNPGEGWIDTSSSDDELDVYIMAYDNDYTGWLQGATTIFGKIGLPPRSAMGVWWSREYKYTQEMFTSQVLQGYADHNLPLDNVVLDNDWHTTPNGGWECPDDSGVTWNTALFPSPQNFTDFIHSNSTPQGHPLHLLLNLHPQLGVNHCQKKYKEFSEAVGVDWKLNLTAICSMQDKKWASTWVNMLIDPLGADYSWVDMCCDGVGCTGVATITPQLWSNAAYDMHLRAKGIRPLVLSRYGGMGNHRYPIGFSGDAFQTWDTLKFEVETTPISSNVLFGWWSHDIGGFHGNGDGNATNPADSELYLRWLQFGAFSPILRTHCSGCERRVWLFLFGDLMAEALQLRGTLVPYVYTAARFAYDKGVSLLRPMYYEWATHPESFMNSTRGQYMFGDSILVAPVADPSTNYTGTQERAVWLPPLSDPSSLWVPWSGSQPLKGGQWYNITCGLSCIPVFVKPGSIIPTQPSGSGHPAASLPKEVIWIVFAGTSGSTILYEDDGATLDYETGGCITYTAMTTRGDMAEMLLSIGGASTSNFILTRQHTVQLRGVPLKPLSVLINGASVQQGNTTPGWDIVSNTSSQLLLPLWTLVVRCAEQSVLKSTSISIFWE